MKPNAYLLLVDDDPVLLRITARALGAAGYFVEVAFSAAECRQLVQFRRPDLILLDVVLPDESGVEVCRWLKRDAQTSGICVVLISGFETTAGHQENGLAAGADAYIVRPVATSELVARMGALLRVRQAQSALQEAQAGLERGTTEVGSGAGGGKTSGSALGNSATGEAVGFPAKIETAVDIAGRLALHFDELLTDISSHCSRLMEDSRLPLELRPHLSQVLRAIQRGGDLTLGLRHYCGLELSQPRLLDLNEYLECLDSRLRTTLGEPIQLEWQLSPGLPPIFADSGMVERLLLILAANARDAMQGGGRFLVQTQVVDLSLSEAARHRGASPGTYVCLSVTDTGRGMDAEEQSRIFEPFFSTKPLGRGFGLGLATLQDVVRQHRGWVKVHSEPGRGSTLKVCLPAASTDAT